MDILKTYIVLGLVVLGVVGVLMVLGAIGPDNVAEVMQKSFAIIGILLIVSLIIPFFAIPQKKSKKK